MSAGLLIDDLRVIHAASGRPIVDGVSLRAEPGEIVGLVGESGCGKTTLGLALLGYTRRGARITGGRVVIGDEDILALPEAARRRVRGGRVAYVPQDPGATLNPARRLATLFEVLHAHRGDTAAQCREQLAAAFAAVGLPADRSFLRRYPHQLSGGQQQRVVLAVAFALEPVALVLDEPTTGLDATTQNRILELVRTLCYEHRTATIYISHDLATVAGIVDSVAVMYAGRVVETGTATDVLHAGAHPYSLRLVAATPHGERGERLDGIPGRAPSLGERPPGCAFAPRCSRATEVCRELVPPLEPTATGHLVACWHAGDREQRPIVVVPLDSSVSNHGRDAVRVEHLRAAFGSTSVLHDVSLTAGEGRCLAVVGESGSGKTTLARCLIGLHPPAAGRIALFDDDLAPLAGTRTPEQRRAIQYVFQNPYASLNPRRRVGDILGQPLTVFEGGGRRRHQGRVEEALDRVALGPAYLSRYPGELSGGERQRVAIARALIVGPTVLLCDEVTSSLDVSVQAAIVNLLRELQATSQLTLVFITHNLPLVGAIADDVVVMQHGRIVERGPCARVLAEPEHPYSRELLTAGSAAALS